MKYFKNNCFRAVTGVLFLAMASSSSATIIDNGTFITDTTNGYDWLDLSATSNLSYNQVIFNTTNSGGSLNGWSIASFSMVSDMLTSAGGDGSYNDGLNNNANLISFLSGNWGNGSNYGSTGDLWAHVLDTTLGGNTSGIVLKRGRFYPDGFSNPLGQYGSIGTALFRVSSASPVSEPSILVLMGLGIFGLGLSRRKMKK